MPLREFILFILLGVAFTGLNGRAHAESLNHVLPLGEKLQGVEVSESEKTIVIEAARADAKLPDSNGSLSCLKVDAQSSIQNFHFEPKTSEGASGLTSVWVRVGASGQKDTVCSKGECVGSFKITTSKSGKLNSAIPGTAELSHRALKLLSEPNFTMCVGVTAPAQGKISAKSLALEYCPKEPECTEEPADISGYWKSTYSCMDSCDGQGGEKSLTIYITQDPEDRTKAKYVDTEGGKFSGSVCGNKFSFIGGGSDWGESGTFVLENAGTASKSSQYSTHGNCCIGNCSDKLVRQENPTAG